MESIISQYNDLYSKADEAQRFKLQDELLNLRDSHDSEWDTILRLCSGVSTKNPTIPKNKT